MFNLTQNFEEILTIEGKKMIKKGVNEEVINIPNTKINIHLIHENVKEKYIATIFKKMNINDNIFYLAR